MIFAANISVEQEVIMAAIMIALFVFTCDVHQYMFIQNWVENLL